MTHITETGLTFASRRRSHACGDAARPAGNAIESRAFPREKIRRRVTFFPSEMPGSRNKTAPGFSFPGAKNAGQQP
jgi:hypothetical protein